jgi:hypothetical protein
MAPEEEQRQDSKPAVPRKFVAKPFDVRTFRLRVGSTWSNVVPILIQLLFMFVDSLIIFTFVVS